MSPNVGRKKGFGIRRDAKARWNGALFRRPKNYFVMVEKKTIRKSEGVDGFVPRPTAKNLFPILRESETVKGFVDSCSADQSPAGNFNHRDFVLAVAAMQDGSEFTPRMHRDIYRKIAENDLFAHRPQIPLVGQFHRAIRLLAGDIDVLRLGRKRG